MPAAAGIRSLLAAAPAAARSPRTAAFLDAHPDVPASLRHLFCVPKAATVSSAPNSLSPEEAAADSVYLCGNSLGLQPTLTRKLINEELDVWQERGVHGHFEHRFGRPWVSVDDHVVEESARLVGASASEVAIMNTLTVNLHLLMVPFYRPTAKRYKIMLEAKAFPSDHYAIESQARFHGHNPTDAMILVAPRDGEFTLRTEDILAAIDHHGDEIALVLFSGVQYYTGQLFEMQTITAAAKAKGCVVGWDLAHAVGNVPLQLHDWDVDFACWCTYKYLNSGPGNIAGAFVHSKHAGDSSLNQFAGWWGSDPSSKFQMNNSFVPIRGANAFRLSNPCVLAVTALNASLQVFAKTDMNALRRRSLLLTGYLEILLDELAASDDGRLPGSPDPAFTIITPRDPDHRGCQLSLLFASPDIAQRVFARLCDAGVVCDERKPDVIRISPAPLYNTFSDVQRCVDLLGRALHA